MELRYLTPLQRAINSWVVDIDFLTCAVCRNTTAFLLELNIEHEGSVVDGKIEIDYDTITTDQIVSSKTYRIKPDTYWYPRPVLIDGKPIRCVRCGHPVWHQQDIVMYHRMANCSGCELCMLNNRETLQDHCQRCRQKEYFPDCGKCIHGESRKFHGLDLI